MVVGSAITGLVLVAKNQPHSANTMMPVIALFFDLIASLLSAHFARGGAGARRVPRWVSEGLRRDARK
jgi:hypothetical protein